jgi:preprotein translocase subunit SecY
VSTLDTIHQTRPEGTYSTDAWTAYQKRADTSIQTYLTTNCGDSNNQIFDLGIVPTLVTSMIMAIPV